ncbi:uncharacterized protein LOC126291827 [Schistocerca gregaria]|uniref:uncharacterized protein LOC126291827 n=1 Tax=Schistocerca gregaria TaxID=7010 RepID=UPI00211EDCC0|nr:uncharacterized protein LOC126291827 [Schistocerca gregaria]
MGPILEILQSLGDAQCVSFQEFPSSCHLSVAKQQQRGHRPTTRGHLMLEFRLVCSNLVAKQKKRKVCLQHCSDMPEMLILTANSFIMGETLGMSGVVVKPLTVICCNCTHTKKSFPAPQFPVILKTDGDCGYCITDSPLYCSEMSLNPPKGVNNCA